MEVRLSACGERRYAEFRQWREGQIEQSYTIQWTPAADATGPVEIYVAGIAANGTRNTHACTASYILKPAAQGPTLRSESPAVSLATGTPEISGGALMALYGEDLKTDAETPDVRINGIEARLIAWSATRLVVVAPDDRPDAARWNRAGASRDGSLVSQSGEFEDPWLGRPARSGETVVLALTAVPFGMDLTRIQVYVPGQNCVVEALEEWGPGLQRLRVVLPELAAGDLPIRVTLDEKALAKELILPVQ